ncbi:MAG: acyloxyacyl hydrolase [Desulfarculaceae bacterium]|nr:acyloxyacyl hydrolase [Desulfarculaceae bacterium]MCF8073951.1 acyloxyacyl hydrolase [Desulfarculaceae bacterium]MCF8102637.1 acyloxyacyl hydrolase [Desulfarculaceae bacterium]MCF8117594.1 acyloxyacyl hydrolase [Desulfarculaceae bacterium]
MHRRLHLIIPLLVLLLVSLALPVNAEGLQFKEWGLTGFGNLSMDIDNGDLYEAGIIAHVAMPLVDNESIRLDFRVEGLVGAFWDYGNGVEVGIIPALRLYFGKAAVQPYIEGGIGPSYNSLDIQELGIGFNFLSFGGVGLRIPLQNNLSLDFGYRLRHISNAGLDDRNHGVTSNQVQVGVAWAF